MGRYQAYPEYKDSGVEWLGYVPTSWNVLPIKYLAKSVATGGTPKNDTSFSEEQEIPWFTPGDFQNELVLLKASKNVTHDSYRNNDIKLYPSNSVLVIGIGATLGKVSFCPNDFSCNQQINVIIPNKIISSKYLVYALCVQVDQMRQLANFTTIGIMNQEKTKLIQLAVPVLAEQEKIANFLDHETAKIDTLIEKQQQLIQLLKEKRQAVISHAVTKGLNPDVPMKDSGVEWLGEVPEGWVVAKLSYRYEVLLGKMLDDKKITGNFLGSYLRNTDVQWGRINNHELPQMDFKPEERDRFSVKKGDLLVCEGGEIGRCAIWTDNAPCFYQKALHRLRPIESKKDVTKFMYYVLFNAVHQERFIGGIGKATIAHLPAETFRQYRFAFPPLSEQKEIFVFLDEQNQKFNLIEEKANFQIELLRERRTALISAAVTGKIDVRLHASRPTGSA